MFDVAIIGCSLVGCYLAGKLVERGFKVLAVEEHRRIGYPNKCTGLVSWRIKKLLPDMPDNIIQNKISKAEFFSPSGSSFLLRSKKPMYVIDRPKLDQYLYKKALDATIKTGESFMQFKPEREGVGVYTNKGAYHARLLVGADGAFSRVAKQANLKQPSHILYGVQSTVNGQYDEKKVELWFGSKIAPGFFAWVVPTSENRAKVGLATKEKPLKYFKRFLKARCHAQVKPDTAGAIRFGLMKKTVADRLLLVGDAAAQVKPFSGGGIVYALTASRIALLSIIKAFSSNDFSEEFFKKTYEDVWKQVFVPGIKKGLWIRRVLYALGDRWIDFLFSLPVKQLVKNWDVDLLNKTV